jgi:hypothetical protein
MARHCRKNDTPWAVRWERLPVRRARFKPAIDREQDGAEPVQSDIEQFKGAAGMRMGMRLASGLVLSCLTFAAAAESTPAVWKEMEFRFNYHGFTTSYSCEGLKHKVSLILAALGARPNPQIRTTGCEIGGGVAIAPGVHVLAAFPEALLAGGEDAQSFAAQTEVVTLSPRRPQGLEMGDCELVEQLRDSVFAEISTRVLTDNTACVPHQSNLGRPYLQLEVLRSAAGEAITSGPR